MAKLTFGQKAPRVLKFLLGMGDRRIFQAIAPYGFDKEELRRGWELLIATGMSKLEIDPPLKADPTLLEKLDAWENKWFPIATLSLERRYPTVYDKLFHNLSQVSGPEVALTVPIFLERLKGLSDMADGEAARELLRARGLDDAVIDQAIGLVEAIGTTSGPAELPDTEAQARALEEAEEAVWDWYIEWSGIARTVIKNRNHLRKIGFLRSHGTTEDEPEDTLYPEVTD